MAGILLCIAAAFFSQSPAIRLLESQHEAACTVTGVSGTATSISTQLDCSGQKAWSDTNAREAVAFLKDPSKNRLTCNVNWSGHAACW
ncbi:MAG TPA: hypothetical protein VHD55_03770 [Candidatus Paceibacterota bacterium]|nr:hypothetical protein [Candidatus Paceibacterota bacterium]